MSFFSNLHSHPNRLLKDHLEGTNNFSNIFIEDLPNSIKEEIKVISNIVSIVHDLGKSTPYFQRYLLDNEESCYSKHSLLSAFIAFLLVKELNIEEKYSFFAFTVVRRHHGNLKDILDETIGDEDIEMLKEQIDKIDKVKFTNLVSDLEIKGPHRTFTIDFLKERLKSFKSDIGKMRRSFRKMTREKDISNYIIFNLIYSILIDADKTDVVVRDPISRINSIDKNIVDEYKKEKFKEKNDINNLRENSYKEVSDKISKYYLDNRIFTITLPTGLGKTLTAFNAAIKLRNFLKKSYRIIYSLPFLSIIDQSSKIFEDILEYNNIEPTSDILLKNHSLSEMKYKEKEYREIDDDMSKILIDGWNSEIIVTTFVQIFNSIISNKNKNLRKFHKFSNSILILDEVQAIPMEYWKVVEKILLKMSKLLDMYIILVTATQPLIFSKDNICSLVTEKDYFNNLNRISLKPYLYEAITIEKLYNMFKIEENKSYLYIFNTIKSAKLFYKLLEELLDHEDIEFLSTHLIPKDRLSKINEIKDSIKEGKRKILISTQLIEAGVDLDFDYVIRDLAPLDCIFQSAGRCNRHALRGKGIVSIVKILDENNKNKNLYCSYIYSKLLLDITSEILQDRKEIEENSFKDIIEEYYNKVLDKKAMIDSDRIINAIYKLKYDSEIEDKESINKFNLINNSYPKINVFIQKDDESIELWKEYKEIQKIKNCFDKKKSFNKLKNKFYQYVVSVPSKNSNVPEKLSDHMYYVEKDFLSQFYDPKLGFITELDNFI